MESMTNGADLGSWSYRLPLLHQIHHGLERLIHAGESTCIDLLSIPSGPGQEALLLQTLGRGEVEASMDALGYTRIWETRFPGVWLVDHYNSENTRIALHIEISWVPKILCSQLPDIEEGYKRLGSTLRISSADIHDGL